MDRRASKREDGRAWNEDGAVRRDTVQQSALHDALLYSLFAFVLKILYVRRRIFYIDHLVYALHIHTFAYTGIMLIVLATIGLNRVIPGAIAGWIIALLWVTFVVQIFLSIRRVYRQGWFISVFKFFFGGFVYLIVLVFALAVTFFITVALP